MSDTLDDGTYDGNTTDDPTIIPISPDPSIEVTKTVSTDNNGNTINDVEMYLPTITIENTGNVTVAANSCRYPTDNNGKDFDSGPT